MDPLRYLAHTARFFTRAQANSAGYDDRMIAAAVRHRAWVRFRHGYYTFPDLWDPLDDVGRHRVVASAVLDSMGDRVALSHVSALVAHGVPVWGVPLDRVHVTRLDRGAGRVDAGVVHHEGLSTDDDVVLIDGIRTIAPSRAAIETASRVDGERALCIFDAVLHGRLCDPEELERRFALMAHWPFMRHLHIPIRMADGRAESVGESRGRWMFRGLHLPAPLLQFQVWDLEGVLVGTCDWAWPAHDLLGEFDGRVKYGRLLQPGQQPGDVVFAEKQREDRLREVTGHRMVRLTWGDYDRPLVTSDRLRRMLRLAS